MINAIVGCRRWASAAPLRPARTVTRSCASIERGVFVEKKRCRLSFFPCWCGWCRWSSRTNRRRWSHWHHPGLSCHQIGRRDSDGVAPTNTVARIKSPSSSLFSFFSPLFYFFLVYMIIFFFIPFRSMSGSLPRSSRLCSPLRRRRHGLSKPQSSAVDRPRLPGQPADRPRRLYACLYPSYKKKKKKTFLINKHSCATNENSKTRTRRRIISPSFISWNPKQRLPPFFLSRRLIDWYFSLSLSLSPSGAAATSKPDRRNE